MENPELIKYDCFRGCTTQTDESTGETSCSYRQGCCKLKDYNWLDGVCLTEFRDIFEVRFKNTRKGFYVNASGQNVKIGDLVVVEAANGHDLGIVTLEGPVVGRQMKCKGVEMDKASFRKIYRKARQFDIEKWQEAIAREQDTMIKARRIAAEMGLEMKIGDVEFQGDGTKAIFYYIADGRVDFRQLIKVFAEEFRIRIEMKQIGARQEAGLIGGLGVCGRELCCANYVTNFQSITTSAARCQDLSLNPQKLAGQCGKLKCCLNYEVATYMDAQSRLPKVVAPLEFEDGLAYLVKTDILRELMYFSYDKNSLVDIYPLEADEVAEVIRMNRNGIRPESLKLEPEPSMPEFVTAVGDDSISRFDNLGKKKSRKRGGKSRGERGDRSERVDRGDRGERGERGDRSDRGERVDRGDRSERAERGERGDRSDRGERVDRGDRSERAERGERGDRPRGDRRGGRPSGGPRQGGKKEGKREESNGSGQSEK